MSWTCKVVDPHDPVYGQLLAHHSHLLFHEPIWAQVVAEGISPRTVAIVFQEGETPKAGAMGFLLGGMGVNIAYFNYPYGSLFGEVPPPEALVRILRGFGRERGVCQVQLVGYPGGPQWETDALECQQDGTQVAMVEGMTPDDLWKSYRRSRRQDIRKIRERGVEVSQSLDPQDVDAVHQCYLETMERTGGVARYKRRLLHAIVRRVCASDRGRMYVARRAGEVLAGMLIVDSAEWSHGLLLAARTHARDAQPNKLLLHTALEDTIHHQRRGLDYMPSGQSASGVASFKNLWGAESQPIWHHTLVTQPVRSWLWRRAYATASRPPFRALLSMIRKRET